MDHLECYIKFISLLHLLVQWSETVGESYINLNGEVQLKPASNFGW